MSALPTSWSNVKLPEIAKIIMGQSPPSSSYNNKGEGLPFFQGKSEFCHVYPTVAKFCSNPKKVADKGDVLISVRAPVGPTNLCKEVSCIGRGLAALRPNGATITKYLFYYLRNIESWLSTKGTGSTFTAISKTDLENIELLLAPLNEQRRIIAKLERLLYKVDACKERLDKIPAILKRFRQSVLAAACSGRLTADWREKNPDVEPAKELLKRVSEKNGSRKNVANQKSLVSKPTDFEIPESWELVLSDDLISFVTSGSRGWAKYYADKGSLFIRIGNLDHGTISPDLTSVQRVNPPKGAEGTRTRIQSNDILISITADVGMIALAPHDLEESYINQHIALARPLKGFSVEYLAWYLASSEGGLRQFQDLQRGMTKVGLGLGDIKSVWVPFPSFEEQQEIVHRVEAFFKKADEIEARYQKAKAFVDKLTQSILAKTFRGELVSQDPDDEPASVLLERIKEERAKRAVELKVKKKKFRRRRSN